MLKLFVSVVNKDLNLIFYTKDNEVINHAQSFLYENEKHSQNFFHELDKGLKALGKKISDLQEVFVVVGPGSFMSMRLTKTFVMTLMMLKLNIDIYLTSSFLLSYFLYRTTFEKSGWNSLLLATRKTKTSYYTVLVEREASREKRKNINWTIKSVYEIEDAFNPAYKKFIVRDFYLNLSDRLLLSTNEEANMKLFNCINSDEKELVSRVIEGEKFNLDNLEECLKRRVLFVKLDKFKDYPKLEKMQDLGI